MPILFFILSTFSLPTTSQQATPKPIRLAQLQNAPAGAVQPNGIAVPPTHSQPEVTNPQNSNNPRTYDNGLRMAPRMGNRDDVTTPQQPTNPNVPHPQDGPWTPTPTVDPFFATTPTPGPTFSP